MGCFYLFSQLVERFDFWGIEGSEIMISESGHSLFSIFFFMFYFIFTIMGRAFFPFMYPVVFFRLCAHIYLLISQFHKSHSSGEAVDAVSSVNIYIS